MEKKKTTGILIIGLVIIISGLFFLLSYWIPRLAFPGNIEALRIYRYTSPVVGKLIADPYNLFSVLEISDIIKSHSTTLYISLFRTLLLIIFAYGLIGLRNLARIVILIICWVTILSAPLNDIYAFIIGSSERTVSITVVMFIQWIIYLFRNSLPHIFIALVYIVYLTRPEVKEMFKEK